MATCFGRNTPVDFRNKLRAGFFDAGAEEVDQGSAQLDLVFTAKNWLEIERLRVAVIAAAVRWVLRF